MATPDDAILEEPDRFTNELDYTKIKSAKNPQKIFLKEMEKRWNKKAGIYLWRYFVDKYDLINAVYSSDKIQKILPDNFKGTLDKELSDKYFDNFKKRTNDFQRRIEKNIVKRVRHDYSELQRRFILSKKDMGLYHLASDFNRYFGTKLSRNAIRDKRLRLLGKKK